jgi:hypothetical protein
MSGPYRESLLGFIIFKNFKNDKTFLVLIGVGMEAKIALKKEP